MSPTKKTGSKPLHRTSTGPAVNKAPPGKRMAVRAQQAGSETASPQPTKISTASKSSLCCECKKDGGDECLLCDKCEAWIHYSCAKLPSSAIPEIQGNSFVQIVCTKCQKSIREKHADTGSTNSTVPDVVANRLLAMESSVKELSTKISQISQSLSPSSSTSNDNDSDNNDADENETGEPRQPQPLSFAQILAKNIVVEQSKSKPRVITTSEPAPPQGPAAPADPPMPSDAEDEKHRRCLVVRGLVEKGQDLRDATELCKLLDPASTVVEVFRMGSLTIKDSNNRIIQRTHPRLLKVRFSASTVARSVLQEVIRLKNIPKYRGVYIRRSMPELERKQQTASEQLPST